MPRSLEIREDLAEEQLGLADGEAVLDAHVREVREARVVAAGARRAQAHIHEL